LGECAFSRAETLRISSAVSGSKGCFGIEVDIFSVTDTSCEARERGQRRRSPCTFLEQLMQKINVAIEEIIEV